ncbi:MAG: hypothetical protein Q7U96_01585 [Chloroflexota bacterium]|nr:hypothetical protein [Chloroflexota bacterium]
MKSRMLISVENGMVQEVFSDGPVECMILDMDIQEMDPDYQPRLFMAEASPSLINKAFASPEDISSLLSEENYL